MPASPAISTRRPRLVTRTSSRRRPSVVSWGERSSSRSWVPSVPMSGAGFRAATQNARGLTARQHRRAGMEGSTAAPSRGFQHLREHSIGLPQVLFQSITHMAPGAAVAYSIYISVPQAQQALPLSVALALIACICAATAIGQLAKLFPSAGGMYTYAAKSLGPWAG